MPTEGRASSVVQGYTQGCTGFLNRSIVVGTPAGGTKIYLMGWVQAWSHPNRWLLLWVQPVCCVQRVRAVMPTYDKWSLCFTLIFHTAIDSVLKSIHFENLFTERFVVFLDLAESWRGKRGNNDNPISTFQPPARRIRWYKPKKFW